MTAPQWPDRRPVSAEELAAERRRSLKLWPRSEFNVWDWPTPAENVKFTCDECAHAPSCALAFDHYNTGGDCLASK